MKILLTTLHSKHTHSSLALPYLAAACSSIAPLTIVIREYTVNARTSTILPQIAAEEAATIAFSCYIWNIEQTLKLASELKLIVPRCFIVLGGPEVSYGSHELMAANDFIDCIVRGEGEETFYELLQIQAEVDSTSLPEELMAQIYGITFRSGGEIITTPARKSVNLDNIPSPFSTGIVDTGKPLVYVETSRGCPFSCAFCISSLEGCVRTYSLERVKSDLKILIEKEVPTIKLVDRTFNYDASRANLIWDFIVKNNRSSRFHFEIAADLLTDENIKFLQNVPKDIFRFEIGVQSSSSKTLAEVGRKSDLRKLYDNITRILRETAITVHLDLIAGLPEENFDGFAGSLRSLLAIGPHHIQVEVLKVLKGTEMRKIARDHGYAFSPYPPYRILKNRWLSFGDICRIEAASIAIDRFYNSGRFATTMLILAGRGDLVKLFTLPDLDTFLTEAGDGRITADFSVLYRLAEKVVPAELFEDIVDSLRFDYCMTGYHGNRLPDFLAGDSSAPENSRPIATHPELAKVLAIPEENRIRTFTACFRKDHTGSHHVPGNCIITFVYFPVGKTECIKTLSIPAR